MIGDMMDSSRNDDLLAFDMSESELISAYVEAVLNGRLGAAAVLYNYIPAFPPDDGWMRTKEDHTMISGEINS